MAQEISRHISEACPCLDLTHPCHVDSSLTEAFLIRGHLGDRLGIKTSWAKMSVA